MDRLVLAAAQQVAERGLAGASARSIAASAGCAASAINYHFGGTEHLFSTVFDRALARTRLWMDARRAEIAALPPAPASAPLALEYVLVQWTQAARPLALLYQECIAARDGRAAEWISAWRAFWIEAAARFGLHEREGRLLHLLFESEALYHLSAWAPALEQAVLREICGCLGEVWLGAGPSMASGALAMAESAAGVISADAIAPAAVKVAEAAARVIDNKGVGGLTHRAVAAEAGVTTGSVTHHFRSIEDLVAGALRGQVMTLLKSPSAAASASPIDGIDTVDQFATAIRWYVTGAPDRPPRIDRRGLFLAAVRRPDMAAAGAVIRFTHGSTTRQTLVHLFDLAEPALSLRAGLVSRLLSTVSQGCAGESSPSELGSHLVDEIVGGLAAATPRRPGV